MVVIYCYFKSESHVFFAVLSKQMFDSDPWLLLVLIYTFSPENNYIPF